MTAPIFTNPLGANTFIGEDESGGISLSYSTILIGEDDDKPWMTKESDTTFQLPMQRLALLDLVKENFITTGTIDDDSDVIYGDTSGGAFTVTLPPIANVNQKRIDIKKFEGFAAILTITGDGTETIDNNLTVLLTGNKGASVTLFPRTATDWSIL